MAAGRKTGGRQAGVPNKVTADVKALAQVYAPEAIKELARLATKAESETARVAAIRELLDRGYGKARQAIDLDGLPAAGMVVTYVTSGPAPKLSAEDYETGD